ncbi:MAG: hypothetical protein CBC49_002725 [Alphaproteobacteria bacterium TMED89]|nr:MAG: hypothetical protein CBC49_002725 [Alphaproteobacteria bacterium TMED89]
MLEKEKLFSLGERISDARVCSNLTTAQLSRRLGVRTGTLSSWQNNTLQPRANRLTMLAGVLGFSPAWLLGGKGAGPYRSANGLEDCCAEKALRRPFRALNWGFCPLPSKNLARM